MTNPKNPKNTTRVRVREVVCKNNKKRARRKKQAADKGDLGVPESLRPFAFMLFRSAE
jgi:hypothetical protein